MMLLNWIILGIFHIMKTAVQWKKILSGTQICSFEKISSKPVGIGFVESIVDCISKDDKEIYVHEMQKLSLGTI
jgi:hypothetical protein